jgi:hypothetical protein
VQRLYRSRAIALVGQASDDEAHYQQQEHARHNGGPHQELAVGVIVVLAPGYLAALATGFVWALVRRFVRY